MRHDPSFAKELKKPVGAKKPASARAKETFTYAVGKSPLGTILVAHSEFGIVSVIAGDSSEKLVALLQDRFRKTELRLGGAKAKAALAQIMRLIENPAAGLDIPLDIRGTDFQQRVWRAVRKIPLGETSTYSAIAEKIRAPRAVRAVGSTCTNNHFFIAIPCHRVLHKGESIAAGFTKSSKRQQMLIMRECQLVSAPARSIRTPAVKKRAA